MGIAIGDVVDIFPCTPLQEGILLSVAKGTATYHVVQVWECTHSLGRPIVTQRLVSAWETVISRHTIFSVFFLEALGRQPPSQQASGQQNFVQVQLHHALARVQCVRSSTSRPVDTLKNMDVPVFGATEPPYRVTVCEAASGDANKVACRLDINHALVDATSLHVLLTDLARVYDGHHQALPPAPEFRAIVEQVGRSASDAKDDYWKQYLTGVTPCVVPTTAVIRDPNNNNNDGYDTTIPIASSTASRLHAFCQGRNMTRSTLIQVAWGMVLAYLMGKRDTCFGYLVSGRDIAVHGVDAMVGPLINLLVSRIDVGDPVPAVLARTEQGVINHFEFQHVSLAQLQRGLGLKGRQLFNTGMTVRHRLDIVDDNGGPGIRFENMLARDSSEASRHLHIRSP
ncbi:condensation domain-containing protein [Nemania diffusa]|nr:condensation domain-containing protein [Nemania diffusa]